jgi:tripartite-type tricarboxylate transporter receptor subunit TctC
MRISGPSIAFALAALAAQAAALPARAQDAYPSRNVTLIIPFAPGGGSDVIARIVGEELGKSLGQSVIFENVAGAGGTTGLARAATAKPDGYTLVIGNAGNAAAAYTLYPDLKYKPDAFVPLAMVARTASVIALRKDFPGAGAGEIIAAMKVAPDKVRLGHAGVGSSNHLICMSFVKAVGADLTLVGYRGAGPALNDLIGGHIDGVCDTATSVAQSIQGGNIRGLVVAGNARLDALPNVPQAIEAGLPEFQAGGWNALFAPAGTPQPIVDKLTASIRTALKTEFVRGRFKDLVSSVPADDEQSAQFLAAHVPREIERYKVLLAGVKP